MYELRASALLGTLPLVLWGILSGGVKETPSEFSVAGGSIFLASLWHSKGSRLCVFKFVCV